MSHFGRPIKAIKIPIGTPKNAMKNNKTASILMTGLEVSPYSRRKPAIENGRPNGATIGVALCHILHPFLVYGHHAGGFIGSRDGSL